MGFGGVGGSVAKDFSGMEGDAMAGDEDDIITLRGQVWKEKRTKQTQTVGVGQKMARESQGGGEKIGSGERK